MAKRFDIDGVGPKKEAVLIDAGYTSRDDLLRADFYDIMRLPGFGIGLTCRIWESLGLEVPCRSMMQVVESTFAGARIENKDVRPWTVAKKKGMTSLQPDEFNIERTTVWSYPKRGDWATHTSQYRGNWPPQVARNIIELYSKPGDTVLDPMVGGGTTPVECRLTGRNSVSVDVNPDAVAVTRDRLDFPLKDAPETTHLTYVGDARNLDLIDDESMDLVATHPPYANIIHYAPLVDGDLSQFNDYAQFFKQFHRVISELYRVLKPGGYCGILIGDTHSRSHYVPISARMMVDFLREGFILKEDVIKREWNCESDRYLSKYGDIDFLLTMHEHVLIFRKPTGPEDCLRNSSIAFFDLRPARSWLSAAR